MSARDAILQRIRATLAGEPDASPPPVPELWPPETRTRQLIWRRNSLRNSQR